MSRGEHKCTDRRGFLGFSEEDGCPLGSHATRHSPREGLKWRKVSILRPYACTFPFTPSCYHERMSFSLIFRISFVSNFELTA